jgi:3,5-epimerase/4-reductase
MGQKNTKDQSSPVFLIYGKSGWIGGLLGSYLKEQGIRFEYGTSRLEDRRGIEADIRRVRRVGVVCVYLDHQLS